MSLSSAWNLLFLAAAMRLVEKGTLLCLTAISYCLLQVHQTHMLVPLYMMIHIPDKIQHTALNIPDCRIEHN